MRETVLFLAIHTFDVSKGFFVEKHYAMKKKWGFRKMLHWLWGGMMSISVIYALVCGRMGEMLNAALSGTAEAITLTLRLGAGYLLFCGWINLLKTLQLPALLTRMISPLLQRLMPICRDRAVGEAVTLNLSLNLLGIGNAATPMGIEAVRLMDERSAASDISMLLILNATSLQLLPTTVLTLRTAAGSIAPGAVILPGLLCSGLSTTVGVLAGLCCRRFGAHHG